MLSSSLLSVTRHSLDPGKHRRFSPQGVQPWNIFRAHSLHGATCCIDLSDRSGSLPKEILDNQLYLENRIAPIKSSLPTNAILLFSGGFSQESLQRYFTWWPLSLSTFFLSLSKTQWKENALKTYCLLIYLLSSLGYINSCGDMILMIRYLFYKFGLKRHFYGTEYFYT